MAMTGSERTALYRKRHPDKALEQDKRAKERRLLLKREVLTHYGGGKCACVKCGFSDIRALSIDHIKGGGTRQKRRTHRQTTNFYRWLKERYYPRGEYQTLCMNCQFVKRIVNGEHNKAKVDRQILPKVVK